MKSFGKTFRKLPFTEEEWKEIKRYQKVPLHKKLAMLDRMRSFMFELWKSNPAMYRQSQKFRRGEI